MSEETKQGTVIDGKKFRAYSLGWKVSPGLLRSLLEPAPPRKERFTWQKFWSRLRWKLIDWLESFD